MKTGHREPGFTMIELMIVLAVVAILAALAYPAYNSQIRQGRRADAQQELMDLALRQEKYRANNVTYASCEDLFGAGNSCPGVPGSDNWGYTIDITANSATGYTLEATATGDQTKDKRGGQSCSTLRLNESDQKCPAECWGVDPASQPAC